ncbi:ectonucleotide pyrophosphatase/phosphodiesterase family member 6-like isoform X1 [Leptotrombidium deliense]|uniref:glycerophosphocholine cholinephosphodiesterase n=1 Tax=Leptotrombidium deliense TaxID=299467 RepID=A0A443SNQ9_9ACAR|nr:ectonucleotide pyrophosphatase/phosphodiesterase family member 6-like isoform X1 [Leptotrombidium deliense]
MALESKKFRLIAFLILVFVVVAILVIFAVRKHKVTTEKGEKLLVIMIDGMRHDFPDRESNLTAFQKLASDGVKAEYLEPVFPSYTYPNWYTISTGLFPENNGFVSNQMYDELNNDFFLMAPHPNASHKHWWNKAEPIWVTAEKAGKKVTMFNWDGCQVEIHNTLPTRCVPYRSVATWKSLNTDTANVMNQIIDEFESNKFSLAMVYYEPVDFTGHKYGPDSGENLNAVQEINHILNDVLNKLKQRGLSETVNVYIMSDHGMARPVKKVLLEDYIDFNDVKMLIGSPTFFMINPVNETAENNIYKAFKNKTNIGVNILKKSEIPDEMGIKHNNLTLPLVLYANPGYYMFKPSIKGKVYPLTKTEVEHNNNKLPPGAHGYYAADFDQMRGITFAIGPAFKHGYLNIPLKQIDHYQVFCHILGLNPKPNNGSWDRVSKMLA